MTEQWLPVVGYEGSYEVSDHGRVRSLDRTGTDGRKLRGKFLCDRFSDSGHSGVALYRNGRKTGHYVHRLVLTAFVGPCPQGMEACHNDGNPANNQRDNLRWDTRSENTKDRARHRSRDMIVRGTTPVERRRKK